MQIIEFESPTLNIKGEIIQWTSHTAKQVTEDLDRDVLLDLLVIPSGMFQMGSPRNYGNSDEHPQHFVRIKSFMMGKNLITQAQWKAVMGKLPPCRFKGDDLPVERVSWENRKSILQTALETDRERVSPSRGNPMGIRLPRRDRYTVQLRRNTYR